MDFSWERSPGEHPQTKILAQMAVAVLHSIGEEIDEYQGLDGCGSYVELLARDYSDIKKFKETADGIVSMFEQRYADSARPYASTLNNYAGEVGIFSGPQSQKYGELSALPYNPQDALNYFMSFEAYFGFLQRVRVTLGLELEGVEFPTIDSALRTRIAPQPLRRGDTGPILG